MTATKLPTARTWVCQLAISVALLLLMTSCGSSDSTAGSKAQEPTPDAGAQATTDPTATPESDSPIDNMIGVPIMDDAAMNEYMVEVLREGEIRTAECMLAEGFEYSPVAPPAAAIPTADDTDGARAFAQARGFGIVAAFNESQFDLDDPPEQPNQTYRASLTPAELDAYEVALYGSVDDDLVEVDGREDDGFPGLGGCKALASEELFELFMVLDEFTPQADEVFDALQADPRMVESNKEWAACMAERGFEVADPDDVRDIVIERLDPILQAAWAKIPDSVEPPAGYDPREDSTQFLSGDHFGITPRLSAEDQQQIDGVGEFEIDLAVANFDCLEPRRESNLEVQREYEQQLVDSIGPALSERLGDN